jgi:hypothetical protein
LPATDGDDAAFADISHDDAQWSMMSALVMTVHHSYVWVCRHRIACCSKLPLPPTAHAATLVGLVI